MALPAPVQLPGVPYFPKKDNAALGVVGASLAAQTQSWPLSAAASLLEPYQRHEQLLPDLNVIAGSVILEHHCTPDISNSKEYTPFEATSASLPSVFLENLENFGFLKRLNVFYATTTERQTFFWDYKSGDLKQFDFKPDENITNIQVVEPNPSVFSQDVKFLLLVSTKSKMRILAVDLKTQFYDTDLEIDISDLGVPKVVSGDGRIFFTGSLSGSSLFEFKYRERESWFKNKVERVCYGDFGGLFGLFKGSSNNEQVLKLELNDANKHIYVLTPKCVYAYSYANGSVNLLNSFELKFVTQRLLQSTRFESKFTKFVGLSKVDYSSIVKFVVIADNGTKIYFRMQNNRGPLEVAYAQGTDEAKCDFGVSNGYTTLISTQNTPNEHKLLAAKIDTARVWYRSSKNQPIPFAELSGFLPLDSPVRLIVLSEELGIIGSNKHDLVLTQSSLYTVQRRPFSDWLKYADPPLSLVHVYGTTQLCRAAIEVASQSTNLHIRENAIQSLFRFGGLPLFLRDETRFLGHSSIRLSPLVDGLAFYLARILMPLWNQKILGGKASDKVLQYAYQQLGQLVKFMDRNRSFSEALSERNPSSSSQRQPYMLLNSSSYNDDAALLSQAEHKAMQALVRLAQSCEEGIAFLRVVLKESHDTKKLLSYFNKSLMKKFEELTFGTFFTEAKNSPVARELVNSLINYVLNRGETVETVASVIQDKCPSYCSTGDVLEYKALEYIHRAKKTKKGLQTDTTSLAQSVNLIKKAASSIHLDTLKDIVDDYVELKYYEGVVHVCLAVGAEQDPANIGVGYLRHKSDQVDNTTDTEHPATKKQRIDLYLKPVITENAVLISDSELKYRAKMAVYDLIFTELLSKFPELADVDSKTEAHRAMIESPDEVWHFALYDWYLAHNRQSQIAQLNTPYVASYLQLGASNDLRVANLLWKWHQKHGDLLAAADVLLGLARGPLVKSLSQRVEFLSRAMGYCRSQPQQSQAAVQMMTMVKAYLGLALLQSDIYAKLEHQHHTDLPQLDMKIFTVSDLFNLWAEPNGLYDMCFAIFEFSDFRDPVEIESCWENLLTKARLEDVKNKNVHYVHVASLLTQLGTKYRSVPSIFQVEKLVPFIEKYAVDYCTNSPKGWIADAFLNAGIHKPLLIEVYKNILKNNELEGEYKQHALKSLEVLEL